MKKILLTTIATGCGIAAFGQGGVLLENGNNSSAHWNLNSSSGPAAPVGNTSVALFWYNGTSFVSVGGVVQITSANGGTFGPDGGLYWTALTETIIPTFSPTGTFEVQGWTGGYASYSAAVAAGAYVGETASFTAAEAYNGVTPGTVPHGLAERTGQNIPGAWNGDLVLTGLSLAEVPEPSTIVLGGLGAAALLMFRRRK